MHYLPIKIKGLTHSAPQHVTTSIKTRSRLTLSPPNLFLAKYKWFSFLFFFRTFLVSLAFMVERYIREIEFELLYHINMTKLKNEATKEIFRQMT